MGIYQRNEIWWYEFEFRGQRVRESTGSDSKTLAIKAERQRRRELEESANRVRAARRPVLFPDCGARMDGRNQARWSESNVSIQEFNLKHLSAYFGSMLLADITPQQIGKYQGIRQTEGASNRTINMEVSTLRMMMKAARLWGAISEDVRMLPERRDIGRRSIPMKRRDCFDACRKSPQQALYTAVVIYCNTGCAMQSCAARGGTRLIFSKPSFKSARQRRKAVKAASFR